MRDFCHVAIFFNFLQILNELVTKNLSFVSGCWCIFYVHKGQKNKNIDVNGGFSQHWLQPQPRFRVLPHGCLTKQAKLSKSFIENIQNKVVVCRKCTFFLFFANTVIRVSIFKNMQLGFLFSSILFNIAKIKTNHAKWTWKTIIITVNSGIFHFSGGKD